ncbi:hypothetical protein B0H11DRAFT_1303275 [Mycena galericulata]|nr:hypothetical protein B0H11DRAFT_1303275 [Mycena galericulata]
MLLVAWLKDSPHPPDDLLNLVNDCVFISFLQDISPVRFQSAGSQDPPEDPAHIDFLSKNPTLLMLLQICSVLPQKGLFGKGPLDNIRHALGIPWSEYRAALRSLRPPSSMSATPNSLVANFQFLRNPRCADRLYVPPAQIIEDFILRCLAQLRDSRSSPATGMLSVAHIFECLCRFCEAAWRDSGLPTSMHLHECRTLQDPSRSQCDIFDVEVSAEIPLRLRWE